MEVSLSMQLLVASDSLCYDCVTFFGTGLLSSNCFNSESSVKESEFMFISNPTCSQLTDQKSGAWMMIQSFVIHPATCCCVRFLYKLMTLKMSCMDELPFSLSWVYPGFALTLAVL